MDVFFFGQNGAKAHVLKGYKQEQPYKGDALGNSIFSRKSGNQVNGM